MSVIRRGTEKRAYSGGAFSMGNISPFGSPFYAIPTNGQSVVADGGGIYMSASQAMRYWPVFSCVRIIADFLAGLPVDAYTGSVGMKLGQSERVDPKPPILAKPSAYASWPQWSHQVLMGLLLSGNSYGMRTSTDRLGYATQIDLIDPHAVKPFRSDGSAVNTTTNRRIAEGVKAYSIKGKTLTDDEVWHLPGPQFPGDLAGLSPIAYAARLIGLGNSAEQFGADFFDNGISPTAVGTTDQPLTSDQAQQIKDRIKAAAANRDVPILGQGVELKPWQVTPTDSMLIEVQKLNAVAIAQIYGIPPDMIGVSERGSTITYVNREQRAQELLDNTLSPWIMRLEDSLSTLFPRTTFVKFDTNIMLRNDMKTRFEAYQIALGGNTGTARPFMTVDEVRQFEDWPDNDELDNDMAEPDPMQPVSTAPAAAPATVEGPQ